MSSIKKNFTYSLILTVSGYVFTFIIFPYVSRVLGVENIGAINFVDSIINYFVILSMMGVGILGIREIATYKNQKEELENVFRDIFFTNGLITLFFIIILVGCIFLVPKFENYKLLLSIGIVKLFFNFTLVEWFFTGTENFKFVTIRSLIIKFLYVIAVLVFVKKSEDLYIYYFLTSLVVVVNAIFNWSYLLKIIKIKIKGLNIKRYYKPIFTLGLYMILTSLYTNFNIVYLGFTSGDKEVGYYTTASKLYGILLSVFTAFTGVMLPRMSTLLSENKIDEFKENLTKSFNLLFIFSFPITIWGIVFAPQIIYIIAGKGFEGAITPMRIIMPLMILIGYAQILVIQILMPLKKDRIILINSLVGAIFGIILNILFVNQLKSIGSAIVWFICELVLVILSQYYISKIIKIYFPFKVLYKELLVSIPILFLCIFYSEYYNINPLVDIIIGCLSIFIYYLFINIKIFKNQMIINLIKTIIIKIKK